MKTASASSRVAPHTQDPRIKATSALHLVLARQEADAAGADEALLCDAGGDYLEATSANLVALKGGRYHTPRGDNGVLEGVTLALVAPMLEAEGFRPAHGAIAPATLLSADEVLLTQTTREVVAVVAIDGRRVGSGRPGPVALALRERFLAQVGGWLS